MIRDATGQVIIYDIFVRDNICYLISTYHRQSDPPLNIVVNGCVAKEVGFKEYEPIRYFHVPVLTPPTAVTINGVTHELTAPVPVVSRLGGGGIAVATLFKNDRAFVSSAVDWYRAQGVEDFYFYFNGPTLPEGLPTGMGIHYGIWDFPYWNAQKYPDSFNHGAQTTFLTMIRLRYMPYHSWMLKH